VASGLVLLLVMLGLPVVPAVCELVCPQPGGESAVAKPVQVIASASEHAPCHSPASADAADAMDAAAPLAGSGMGAGAPHACEHPAMLSSPRAPEALRLPEPSTTAWETSRHLSPRAGSHALVITRAAARAPSPPPGAAFSPVLRI
jgi:hypothetical protein